MKNDIYLYGKESQDEELKYKVKSHCLIYPEKNIINKDRSPSLSLHTKKCSTLC